MGTITATIENADNRLTENKTDERWDLLVERLYREQFSRLCWSARRFLDTQHASEEAVQEGFARFAGLAQRPRSGCELSYLRSIVMNEARSTLRRRRVRERRTQTFDVPLALDATSDAAFLLADTTHIRTMLDSLPTRQRQVVTLRHLVGLSESETAERLAISTGSVKTHSSRGLSALRTHMELAA